MTNEESEYNFRKLIHDALQNIGIKVRELPEPPKPKSLNENSKKDK